jgi:7,8-dihydropterin-6-yl-methyl-4-(beta-D-ribofuranosyl)aminobenzene 5'-phosphate synthase
MTYPGLSPVVASQPTRIADGVALTGILPIFEVMNSHALIPALADLTTGLPLRNAEQALAVNVKGRGIVLITGCGHPTLPKLVARSQAAFDAPVVGVIGGLHLTEVPDSVVQGDIALLQGLNAQVVGLSPHDSDPPVIERFRAAFPAVYQEVMVGQPIRLTGH